MRGAPQKNQNRRVRLRLFFPHVLLFTHETHHFECVHAQVTIYKQLILLI